MKKLDPKIFYLKHYLSKNEFNRRKVADYLYVTERHLSRLLKRWEHEGLLVYMPGQGRGNASSLEFIVDLEEKLISSYLLNIEEFSLEELEEIMELPISIATKTVLTNELLRHIFSTSKSNDSGAVYNKFVDYYNHLPRLLFNVEDRNYATLTIKFNVLSRLYQINNNHEVEYQIVFYDEWVDNTLIIYLRKDIKYYDGTIMGAKDVVDSLRQMFFLGSFRYLRQYIVNIDIVDTFKFSIEFTTKLEIIRYLLGTLSSGLYKYVEGKLLTSGPFYVKSKDSKRIILKRNPFYFGQQGDVHQVELTSDIKNYSQYIKKNKMRSTSITDNSVIEYIMVNPESELLNNNERQYILHLVSNFISRYIVHVNHLHFKNSFTKFHYEYTGQPVQIKGMLTITYHESVKDAQQLVYFLQQNNIAAVAVPSTSRNPKGDLYWDVTLQEQIWYAKMLTTEPFGSWFINQEASKKLLNYYKNNYMKMWINGERTYENWLINNAYFIPIKHVKRQFSLPLNLLNLSSNAISILDYNKFYKR